MKRAAPNAELSMSRTSSSGCETGFSMRMKRAGRFAAAAWPDCATAAMFGAGAVSTPSMS